MTVNKLGEIKNAETGEVVVEMFGPPNALSQDDALSHGLYLLSETIIRGLLPDKRGGGLGGDFGYGVEYENEVFLMYPDYMEEECSCGFSDRTEPLWKRWHEENKHKDDCYQTILHLRTDTYAQKVGYSHEAHDSKLWNKYRRHEERVMTELRKRFGVDRKWGAAVHCTCGHKEAAKRFSESLGDHDQRCPVVLPNFWHKASNLRVEWYKWIGRDMEVNRTLTGEEWRKILLECYESLPTEAREKAKAEHEHENTPEYLARKDAAMTAMFKAMQSIHAECVKKGHDDPDGHCHRCGLVTDWASFSNVK